MTNVDKQASSGALFGLFGSALEYMIDAGQRGVLFMDVMRQRGNQYREHLAETVPHVLDYAAELVVDGRTLKRPVYIPPTSLVRAAFFLSSQDGLNRRSMSAFGT